MKYGRIRIEDGWLYHTSHMLSGSIPISDIVWAFHRRESPEASDHVRQVVANLLVVVTKRGRQYQFPMSEKEVLECLQVLCALNPRIAAGFPRGSRILLQNLPNTRDLGALETMDGRHILPGRLLRSGELYHLSMSDLHTLEREYRLQTIIDLRSVKERKLRPDDPLSQAQYYHIPLADEDADGFFEELTLMDMIGAIEGDPQTYMQDQYVRMIRDPYVISQLARVIEVIRQSGDGAVLWHCTLGKDRTDVVTAILLSIMGVPKETILKDYLRSNLYLAADREYALELMASRGFERDLMEPKINALYGVKERYLDRMFLVIEREYGSVNRFLRRGLYLTPRTIEDLCGKYLI